MVPFFDINNNFVVSYLPSYKRLPKWVQTLRGYLGALVWSNSVFMKYMYGSDDLSFYSPIVTYNKYDKVIDAFGVYESQQDFNASHDTSDENFWYKVQDSFISSIERTSYVCRSLQLEYALNHYFKQQLTLEGLTGWKQPTSTLGPDYFPKSDIYLSDVTPQYYSVCGFTNLHPENSIYTSPIGFFAFTDLIVIGSTFYQYAINIPLSVYNDLGATNEIRESVVRNFVDKINVSGCQYIIITY